MLKPIKKFFSFDNLNNFQNVKPPTPPAKILQHVFAPLSPTKTPYRVIIDAKILQDSTFVECIVCNKRMAPTNNWSTRGKGPSPSLKFICNFCKQLFPN